VVRGPAVATAETTVETYDTYPAELREAPLDPSPDRPGRWGTTALAQRLAERVLSKATWLLPPGLRADFAEELGGNLACTESWREWMAYLVCQLFDMPYTAWVYRREQRRFSR
jgi:hypothetical protein